MNWLNIRVLGWKRLVIFNHLDFSHWNYKIPNSWCYLCFQFCKASLYSKGEGNLVFEISVSSHNPTQEETEVSRNLTLPPYTLKLRFLLTTGFLQIFHHFHLASNCPHLFVSVLYQICQDTELYDQLTSCHNSHRCSTLCT